MNETLLELWIQELKRQQETYQMELRTLPQGSYSCSQGGDGYVRHCWVFYDENGEKQRKGIGKKPELRMRLARKAYLEKAIKTLSENIMLLEALIAEWTPCSPKEIIASLPAPYCTLPEQEFLRREFDAGLSLLCAGEEARIQAHQAWGAQPYQRSDWHSEHLTLRTTAGLYVRSKAEMLIAEQLYRYGVPFRYEQILQLGNRQYAPDFTFEAVDGSEFYLEFFGMMDNEEYAANCWSKILTYKQAGIVPWRNALYLYATGNNIDMRQVEAVIKNWIIPRM